MGKTMSTCNFKLKQKELKLTSIVEEGWKNQGAMINFIVPGHVLFLANNYTINRF